MDGVRGVAGCPFVVLADIDQDGSRFGDQCVCGGRIGFRWCSSHEERSFDQWVLTGRAAAWPARSDSRRSVRTWPRR